MRSNTLLLLIFVGLLLHSCVVDEESEQFAWLTKISEMRLSIDEKYFFTADSIVQLDLKAEFFDKKGNKIEDLKPVRYDIIVNNKKEYDTEISLAKEATYQIKIQVNSTLSSNTVDVKVVPLLDVIEQLNIDLSAQLFTQFEDIISLKEYITIEMTDGNNGKVHPVPVDSDLVDLFINGNPVNKEELLPADLVAGESVIEAQIGEVQSNGVKIEIINPAEQIEIIQLDFKYRSQNPYTLVNNLVSFNYEMQGIDGRPLFYQNRTLKIGNQEYDYFDRIKLEEPGEFVVHLECYGKKSNELTLFVREDKVYEKKKIPVIFHVVHDGGDIGTHQNVAYHIIQDEIERVNEALDNTFGNFRPKGLNAVNTYFEIIPAEKDPQGNKLSEIGVNRIMVNNDFSTKNETGEFMFNNLWNPNEYLNIFVMEINPGSKWANFSWAYYPILSQPLPGIKHSDVEPTLTFGYGIMLNNNHFDTRNQVLVHELGHVLSLRHTWVPEDSECYNSDYVNDTQDYVNITRNHPTNNRKDCEGKTFISTNYMDYNLGNYNSFTYDQRERMQFTYENAYFFPRNSSLIGGRKIFTQNWKGKFDKSIEPIRCRFEAE